MKPISSAQYEMKVRVYFIVNIIDEFRLEKNCGSDRGVAGSTKYLNLMCMSVTEI